MQAACSRSRKIRAHSFQYGSQHSTLFRCCWPAARLGLLSSQPHCVLSCCFMSSPVQIASTSRTTVQITGNETNCCYCYLLPAVLTIGSLTAPLCSSPCDSAPPVPALSVRLAYIASRFWHRHILFVPRRRLVASCSSHQSSPPSPVQPQRQQQQQRQLSMDQKTAQRLQSEMNEEVKRIQDASKRLSSLVSQRAKLLAQQNENEMVEKELQSSGDGDEEGQAAVWKLVGPVLVKVEVDEARSNVASRLKWFKEEMSQQPHSTQQHSSTQLQPVMRG